jgi:N-acetylmuramic acid 6-phosphate (MurNAc-6-P) etherase
MIDLHASSAKLRDRATRLVAQLLQCDYATARQQLEANDWNLRAVVNKIDK